MNKKQNLINALNKVVDALKTDSVLYKWTQPSSCNCGLVVQALLGKNEHEIWSEFIPLQKALKGKNIEQCSWKNAVHHFCSVSGKPLFEIFETLEKLGLAPKDMVHLEYLENPVILKNSKIATERVFFNLIDTKEYPTKYWEKKENVVLYLESWVDILEKESLEEFSGDLLEEAKRLLASVAEKETI